MAWRDRLHDSAALATVAASAPSLGLTILVLGATTSGYDPGADTVLVPVPSRPAVVRSRGHDPMLRITRSAVRRSASSVVLGRLLEQRLAVPDQAGLDSRQRAANR